MISKTTYSGLWVYIRLAIILPFINWKFHQLCMILSKEHVDLLEIVFIQCRFKLY